MLTIVKVLFWSIRDPFQAFRREKSAASPAPDSSWAL
jgi:hypothetical protein